MTECEYCHLLPLTQRPKSVYRFGKDLPDTEYQASIFIRSYQGGHFVLVYEDADGTNSVPIAYCPMCGRKLCGAKMDKE